MYFPNFSNEGLERIVLETRNQLVATIAPLILKTEQKLYERDTDLCALARAQNTIYIIQSGQVELSIEGKGLLIYEVGDLVGLEAHLPLTCSAVAKEFAVKASPISITTIEKEIGANTILKLLACFSAMILKVLSLSIPSQQDHETMIKPYEDGDVIVKQGSYGDDIYTLIEGEAEVMVDGKLVGEIKCDEVFGALAAITNIGRTATIISRGRTLVLGIKKDRLIELIKIRPGTVEKLIGDLTRVIQDLNKKPAQQ